MAKTHVWRIKKQYLRQLKRGDKDVEVRVGYPQIKKAKKGDLITFENYGVETFEVVYVKTYDSFRRMLELEGVENVLPGMTFDGALKALRGIYPPHKEALGVYAFKLKYLSAEKKMDCQLVKASDLLKAEKTLEFSAMVQQSYALTDWITEDYPNHCDHFYSKYVPGIFDGEREIISCYLDGKMVATAYLKKTNEERKLSTLFIADEHRRQGIASRLLEKCFEWLGTTKPLITIADYKLEQFAGLIRKYDWEETEVLEAAYYNTHSREHVFNGTMGSSIEA